jgi:hypothetical protein
MTVNPHASPVARWTLKHRTRRWPPYLSTRCAATVATIAVIVVVAVELKVQLREKLPIPEIVVIGG